MFSGYLKRLVTELLVAMTPYAMPFYSRHRIIVTSFPCLTL